MPFYYIYYYSDSLKMEESMEVDIMNDKFLPSASECNEQCHLFANITNTDTALAMMYLQDRQWNLQVIYTTCNYLVPDIQFDVLL